MNQKKYLAGIAIMGIAALILLSGCTGFAITCEDQSREQLSKCNTDCGEGILSNVCKTGCTAEHNNRLDQCAEKR